MKIFYSFIVLTVGLLLSANAQRPLKIIVGNAGSATANPPEKASLQIIDIDQGTSFIASSFPGYDIKDLRVYRNKIFVAASDTVYIFSIDPTGDFVNPYRKIAYQGAKSVLANFDTLYVGRENSLTSSLAAFRISTGQLLRNDNTLSGKFSDICLDPYHNSLGLSIPHEVGIAYTKYSFNGISLDSSSYVASLVIPNLTSNGGMQLPSSFNNIDRLFPDLSFGGSAGRFVATFKNSTRVTKLRSAIPNSFSSYHTGLITTYSYADSISQTRRQSRYIGKSRNGFLGWYSLFPNTNSDSNLVAVPDLTYALYSYARDNFYASRGSNTVDVFSGTGTYLRSFPTAKAPKIMAFFGVAELSGVISAVFNSVAVYPNPAKDWVEVSGFTLESKIRYSILSSEGKLIREDMLTGPIAVSGLPKGIYWLKLNHPNGAVRVLPLTKE